MKIKLKTLQLMELADYVLTFNNSSMSFDDDKNLSQKDLESQFSDFDYYYLAGRVSYNYYVSVIIRTRKDITKVDEFVELQKVKISSEKIVEKIKFKSPYTKKSRITDLFSLDKDSLLMDGTVDFSYTDDIGEEYPFFGVLLKSEGMYLVEEFHKLLRVFLIDNKYYFVTHFEKPESCARGVVIYRLEEMALVKVFDYSESTFQKREFSYVA